MNAFLPAGICQWIVALVTLFTLSACTLIDSNEKLITPVFTPIDSSYVENAFSMQQKMTGEFDGHSATFVINTEIEEEKFAMVGSSINGATLFYITQKNGAITSKTFPPFPNKLPIDFMLVDFQLTYLPAEAILERLDRKNQISKVSYTLEDTANARVLRRGDKDIIEINYSDTNRLRSNIEFHNRQYGYHYNLETISLDTW